ncbi:MAG: hypothetical protein HF967_10500, partial [Methanosarcinales archaeon]|nr:hypothetical protein [Methanosarcinales archaeon]
MKEIINNTIVRKSISIFMALIMITSLFVMAIPMAVATEPEPQIISVDHIDGNPGDFVEMTLWINNAHHTHTLHYYVYFDPNVVRLVSGYGNHGLLEGQGRINVDLHLAHENLVQIITRNENAPGHGFHGDHWLANVTFEIIGNPGDVGALTIYELALYDDWLNRITNRVLINGSVTILGDPIPPITAINVTPATSSLIEGETQQFTATAIPTGAELGD